MHPSSKSRVSPNCNLWNEKERRPSRQHAFICRIASKPSQHSVWRITTVSDQGRLSRHVDHITFIKLCVPEELNMETPKGEDLVAEESTQDRGGDSEAAETFFAGWASRRENARHTESKICSRCRSRAYGSWHCQYLYCVR